MDFDKDSKYPPGISETISSLSPQEMYDILVSLKVMAATEPEQARQLLRQNPQLCFGVFCAMKELGMSVSPKKK
ncbi:hypothetical protein ADUPG1_008818 [Aduncisulcus paluster]|uniref:Cleavage stimulation factor subunit 2 hinge domain-containing protein n=1 Tax=Aduncisulcus paluster TaxID=2918883 RepID=A0ABQ5KUI4_9EUKA|nr:hypothetical protein ADUPG1_008818 [Aduncisulcus paluster]